MTNNDILRRIRYIFDFNDTKMMTIFSLAEQDVSRQTISSWLKKEEDEDYKNCTDKNPVSYTHLTLPTTPYV